MRREKSVLIATSRGQKDANQHFESLLCINITSKCNIVDDLLRQLSFFGCPKRPLNSKTWCIIIVIIINYFLSKASRQQ